MEIKKIFVDNFKAYRKCAFEVNSDLNVFTGTNNAGKTTILEAISLWYECFGFLITKANRGVTNLNLRRGDYRLGNKAQNYVDYREVSSVRSYRFEDIFFDNKTSEEIDISLTFLDRNGDERTIGFLIKAASGNNYEIRLKNHDNFDFQWLNSTFQHLPEPIGCFFASPVAAISVGEKFTLDQHIKRKVNGRQSFVYIRNRIHRLSQKPTFGRFKDNVSYILNGGIAPVDFEVKGDISKDINIDVMISLGNGMSPKEISLLGSGTLQIIELLLTSYEEPKDLNVILLDEPDSHIHRDIQKRLIEVFISQQDVNNQLFITTHNESLIRSVPPKNIFHVDESVSSSGEVKFLPITSQPLPRRQKGISASHYTSVLRNLGCESSLDLLNAMEADRLIFVEGPSDADVIQSILEKSNVELTCVYWAFKGLDNLIKKIAHYRDFLSSIGMDESLWSKAVLVIDADFMTSEQKQNLQLRLQQRLQVPCKVWSSYTLESTILTDIHLLKGIVKRLLLSRELELDDDAIHQALRTQIDDLVDSKRDLLQTDVSYRERITRQIQNRSKILADSLSIVNIFEGGEAMFFQNFDSFAREQLDAGNIYHLADKDDVKSIINNSIRAIVEEHQEEFCLGDIVSESDQGHLFEEWTQMVRKITEHE